MCCYSTVEAFVVGMSGTGSVSSGRRAATKGGGLLLYFLLNAFSF